MRENAGNPDAELMRLLRRWRIPNCHDGDEGVRLLLHRYGPRLRWILDDNEDLLQDCIVRVLNKIETTDPIEFFRAWLCRIAVNLMATEIRGRKRRRTKCFTDLETSAASDGASAFSPSSFAAAVSCPEETLERTEQVEALREALRNMEERDRTLIELRDLRGLTFKEIGDAMEMTEGAVRTAHFRALARLRQALSDL